MKLFPPGFLILLTTADKTLNSSIYYHIVIRHFSFCFKSTSDCFLRKIVVFHVRGVLISTALLSILVPFCILFYSLSKIPWPAETDWSYYSLLFLDGCSVLAHFLLQSIFDLSGLHLPKILSRLDHQGISFRHIHAAGRFKIVLGTCSHFSKCIPLLRTFCRSYTPPHMCPHQLLTNYLFHGASQLGSFPYTSHRLPSDITRILPVWRVHSFLNKRPHSKRAQPRTRTWNCLCCEDAQ